MFLNLISNLFGGGSLPGSLVLIVGTLFQLWMLIDAIRRQEWMWAAFILFFSVVSALFYYFMVFQPSGGATVGFELPGAHQRHRIKELEAQIHHLDKAHHHSQLGDIYFQGGKLDKAESCYRAALERDPDDLDTRAHWGQCLLRQKKAIEARPVLEKVCAENPRHDYGHTMMAFAETLTALGEIDTAIRVWEQVNEEHSYARARVQLAELYLRTNQTARAQPLIEDVLTGHDHLPAFQRKRERVWFRRARSLKAKIGA